MSEINTKTSSLHVSVPGMSLILVCTSFSRIMYPVTLQKSLRNGLRYIAKSSRPPKSPDLNPMSWTKKKKSDPWIPHLTTYRSAAKVLVTDTIAHVPRSCGVHALGSSCIIGIRRTYMRLGR